MKLVGIIGAMEEEVMSLKELMVIKEVRSIASLDFYVGTLYDRAVVLVRSGIGKVSAAICAQILIDIFYVDAIINTGVAGALSSKLEIGDIVISKDAMQHDVDATIFGYKLGEIPRMTTSIFEADEHLIHIAEQSTDLLSAKTNVFVERIVSGDQFVSNPVRKATIIENFGGFCVEMEGAAIAQVCAVNHVPFVIIRSISDKADDSAQMNFQEFTALAAMNSCKMLERMFELMKR